MPSPSASSASATGAAPGADDEPRRASGPHRGGRTDLPVLVISGGLLAAFVIAALVAPGATGSMVEVASSTAARWFGPMWQVLLLATFVVALGLAFSRYGRVRLGGRSGPEYPRFQWLAMVLCTLLAGGGVFFAAGEPVQHFTETPPLYAGTKPGSAQATNDALAQSFAHWGFLAWAVLGTLGTVVMMRGRDHGMPLRPRTLLYPLLGERIRHSKLGTVVDVICIIAVVAGTVGPIGFLGLQVSYGLSHVFQIPDGYPVQLAVIVVLTAIAVVSVITGINRGIQFFSRLNVWLAVALMVAFLVLGSAGFVLDSFLGGFGQYVRDFVPLALNRGDHAWLGQWTVFYFGWFLGYAPLMAIFVARISRGRTLRDLVVSSALVAPVATMVWFTVFGGTGILFEQQHPGAVSGPLKSSGMNAAVISIADQFPGSAVITVALLLLTLTFVVTTTDSMSYSISAAGTTSGEPSVAVRAFWGLLMGAAAAVLIVVGEGSITALQSFIVVTAVPAGFVVLPTLWTAPRIAREMAVEQGIQRPQDTPVVAQEEAQSKRPAPDTRTAPGAPPESDGGAAPGERAEPVGTGRG